MSKPLIDIPKEKLQQVRMDMFRKVQREKKIKKRIVSVTFTAMLCLSLILSIRVSPTIASQVAKIPGFQAIVSAIAIDKGIKDIVDHDYYEEINVTQSKNGLSLTLQGAIADNSGIVLFYDADASFDISALTLEKVQLFQGDDEIGCGCTFTKNESNQTYISSSVEYNFLEPIVYTSKDFKAVFHFNDEQKGNIDITLPFSLKKDIAKEKTFTANRTIDIDGQKFTITQIRRSPLKVALDIEVAKDNAMQILALDDVAIITESGERRDSMINGNSIGGNIRDGKFTLYLQSNYFDDPEALTVMIGAVHAVPKGEDFIEVDFGTKEILMKPNYFNGDISAAPQSVSVKMNKDNQGKFLMFSDAIKEDGTMLEFKGISITRDEQYVVETTQFEEYNGRAKLYLNYYANPIGKNIELNIPLQ
ncbi:DUF4179 domain-containing protein [Lysinibacillus fusiformis]|uniref:DUF4179 domain-containing protein n=1 Tax=Lysinibacillus fusiformis TaxID=28031 RepID=UPI001882E634|nr:DUF4179 domain-containing protein [Lysinibacillus fusiformis]MBD8521481.1 DUF4179 domain-containing protein [Lysinibacillus fusiformis]